MAYYFPGHDFNPDSLQWDKLTHIVYSFTEVVDNEMKFRDDSFTSHHTNLGWAKMEDIEGTPAAIKIREKEITQNHGQLKRSYLFALKRESEQNR
jgi:GH18 family chitinase